MAGAHGDVCDRETAQTGEKSLDWTVCLFLFDLKEAEEAASTCFVIVGGLGVTGLFGSGHASWDRRRPAVNHPEHPDSRWVYHTSLNIFFA